MPLLEVDQRNNNVVSFGLEAGKKRTEPWASAFKNPSVTGGFVRPQTEPVQPTLLLPVTASAKESQTNLSRLRRTI